MSNVAEAGLAPEQTHTPVLQAPHCTTSSLPVAAAVQGLGQPVFPTWGVRRRLHGEGVIWVCECSPSAGRACVQNRGGCHPRSPGWRGAATVNADTLGTLAAAFPQANFATRTSGPLGLIGITVADGDGEENLAMLERDRGTLPMTVTVGEDSGVVLWFRTVTRDLGNGYLAKGVKVAGGDGGFLMLPGSRQMTGNARVWLRAPDALGIAPLPQAWIDPIRFATRTGRPNVKLFSRPEV
jgi:hypothetical protein